jgi:hypothetical protein
MELPMTSQQRAAHQFVRPEPTLGTSKQNIRQQIKRWMANPHMVMWRDFITHRRVRKLVSNPTLNAKTRLLSFNGSQFRAVTGLLTGHNTLRRHLYIMGPIDNPSHRRCAAKEETEANVLCECEALTLLRHTYLGSFFLNPDDIKSLGAIWNFSTATGLP